MGLRITKVHSKATRTKNETIEFEVTEKTNLAHYAVTDNTYTLDNEISNVHVHLYKFPNQSVNKGDKVILHTGEGKNAPRTRPAGATTDVYDFYCNSGNFIWNDDGDTAKLYKMDFIHSVKVTPNTPPSPLRPPIKK